MQSYLPLDENNYYRPLAGSSAIDAGIDNDLVWDDFSGNLIEGSYSLGAFDGAATPTNFGLLLNGVDSYVTFSPAITMNTGDTCKLLFATDVPEVDTQFVDYSGSSEVDIYITATTAALFYRPASGATSTVDGDTVARGASITSYLDNEFHELVYTCSGTRLADRLGISKAGGRFFAGSLKGLEFNIGGTITRYEMNSGEETEAASIGEGTMMFINPTWVPLV